MTAARVDPSPAPGPREGLRERRKIRTRVAIEEAALDLFEEQGYEATTVDQIAARAEVATATLFRYFSSKAELLVSEKNEALPAIRQAVIDRPPEENGLEAIRHAVLGEWVPAIDPLLTARRARIVGTSDQLSGLSYHRGRSWLLELGDALAQRQGVAPGDERCVLVVRIALATMASAVEGWIARGCDGDLGDAIAAGFDLAAEVLADLSARSAT